MIRIFRPGAWLDNAEHPGKTPRRFGRLLVRSMIPRGILFNMSDCRNKNSIEYFFLPSLEVSNWTFCAEAKKSEQRI